MHVYLISVVVQWSQWAPFDACSATCGGGNQTRTRTCSATNACAGNSEETRACNTQVCPGEFSNETFIYKKHNM